MRRVREFSERFRVSDGRTRAGVVSGVAAVAAAVALLVGVLPVLAHENGTGNYDVHPVVVGYGGSSGACAASISVGGVQRLPSIATKEFHINNPQPGITYEKDGITVHNVRDRTTNPKGRVFDITISASSPYEVYDVVVNGGPQNNHYDYDNGGPGSIDDFDTTLHAPTKNQKSLHNLSHINICYDVPGLALFTCDVPVTRTDSSDFQDISFGEVTARIFGSSEGQCVDKRATFLINNDGDSSNGTPSNVELSFAGNGGSATGRMDITKVFVHDGTEGPQGDPAPELFEPLRYSLDPPPGVELDWCALVPKQPGDGDWFDDVLDPNNELAPEDTLYPSTAGATALTDGSVACTVAEFEDARGVQVTVVAIKFIDPRFY